MKYITGLSPEEAVKLLSETDATKNGCTGNITKWFYGVRKKIGEDEWLIEMTDEQHSELDGLTGEDLLAKTLLTREQLDGVTDSINHEEWEDVQLI